MLCEASWFGVSCFGVFFDFVGPCNNTNCTFPARYESCGDQAFDADIAGNGVVFAFVISVVVTTVAAICATTIDHYTGSEHTLLPRALRKKSSPQAERERQGQVDLWRNVLDRLILAFADQQLVTGFALLTGAWIKLSRKPAFLSELESGRPLWPYYWMPSSSFALVVFLCCGSSSAHLACLLVLRNYFVEHKVTARVRIALFIVFSLFLTATIALSSSFTAYFLAMVGYVYENMDTWTETTLRIAQAFVFLIPMLAMVWIFWICSLQLLPGRRASWRKWLSSKLVDPLRRRTGVNWVWRKLTTCVSDSFRKRLTRWIKGTFWTLLLGDPVLVFALQIILATLSVAWILLQRFAAPPRSTYYDTFLSHDDHANSLCSLRVAAAGYDAWSLGQTLPMFLLALPVLSAWETYIEERQNLRKGIGIYRSSSSPVVVQSEQEFSLIPRGDSAGHARSDSEGVVSPSAVAFSPRPTYYDADDTSYQGWTSHRPDAERPMLRDTYHRLPSETYMS